MSPQAKGDQEVLYFGPGQLCGGLDYSLPYNCLPQNSLAPGTINTSQINGFVTSSPWVADSPWNTTVWQPTEFVLGFFTLNTNFSFNTPVLTFPACRQTIIVTTIAVYVQSGPNLFPLGTPVSPARSFLFNAHTWAAPEISVGLAVPGNAVSFIEINGTVYFTGIMLNGIFSITFGVGVGFTFAQATNYVCGYYIGELAGRMFVAQCRFPGGGGTGVGTLPTVAWSGPGQYSGSGALDPWNPANGLGGGFNLLADVPDQISGIATMGRSAIIFRLQGLSQMDPTNSGLQPFTFYHLWASDKGVGAYQGTVAQFGYTAYFRSSDNVYSLNLASGPQPIGPKIIAKMNSDLRTVANTLGFPGTSVGPWYWHFGSIVTVAGEQHYLLTFSAMTLTTDGNYGVNVTAFVYDYNVTEGCWHQWDLQKYIQQNGNASSLVGFSCPIYQCNEQIEVFAVPPSNPTFGSLGNDFILVGAFNSYGTTGAFQPTGIPAQFVFYDYDFNSQWITLQSLLYPPLEIPITTITFRAEILALGHKLISRRVRLQADNAPIVPSAYIKTLKSGAQQQARCTWVGTLPGNTVTATVNWTRASGPVAAVPYMQGNYPPEGSAIQTYYADMVLNDEMIQTSLLSFIDDPLNPWNSLPAFRLCSVSLLATDPKGSTQ